MRIQRIEKDTRSALSAEQKIAFVILLFLGLGGIFFGFKSFGANISRPIQSQIAKYATGEPYLTASEREAKEVEDSKIRDSDSDGLTDYDELYVYKSSPYLADSDSDGFDDKSEIFSGNDPNCPKDANCSATAPVETTTETDVVGELLSPFTKADEILSAGEINLSDPSTLQSLVENMTSEELRNALLQAGIPKEQLDQIDDETLRSYFKDSVNELSDGAEEDTEDDTVSP